MLILEEEGQNLWNTARLFVGKQGWTGIMIQATNSEASPGQSPHLLASQQTTPCPCVVDTHISVFTVCACNISSPFCYIKEQFRAECVQLHQSNFAHP